ncbi:MAG: DUF1338 domain-containing protein [Flammeovirgaceae bacterium]
MYQKLIEPFWLTYQKITPSAKVIHNLLEEAGNQVYNDHIAFRTLNIEGIALADYTKALKTFGYEPKGEYRFEQKKLNALHFEHHDPEAPKIFVSELQTHELSKTLQDLMWEIADKIPQSLIASGTFIYSGRTWGTISYEDYQQLLSESEYAAWFYVFGFCANHFTINVNRLNSVDSLEELNELLKANGFTMNSSGGEIKGSPAELLEQSSIMADRTVVEFAQGKFEIPSCYYEFAKRYPDASGDLYSGFIAKSADKIFESTNVLT